MKFPCIELLSCKSNETEPEIISKHGILIEVIHLFSTEVLLVLPSDSKTWLSKTVK
jgi:hypothetical protein